MTETMMEPKHFYFDDLVKDNILSFLLSSDQHDGALPACPEADAVERLLSAEVFTLFFFVSCISFPSSALSQFGVRTDLNSLEHSFHHSFLFFESLCSPFLGSIRRLKSLRPSQC